MELLYAASFILVAETKELIEKFGKWKGDMQMKGLRENAGKTKVMRCWVSKGQVEVSRKVPCTA